MKITTSRGGKCKHPPPETDEVLTQMNILRGLSLEIVTSKIIIFSILSPMKTNLYGNYSSRCDLQLCSQECFLFETVKVLKCGFKFSNVKISNFQTTSMLIWSITKLQLPIQFTNLLLNIFLFEVVQSLKCVLCFQIF